MLKEVANEDEHHVMMTEARKAVDERVRSIIVNQERAFSQLTLDFEERFAQHLEKTKKENDKALKEVKNVELLLKETHRSLFLTQVAFGVSSIFLLGVILLK